MSVLLRAAGVNSTKKATKKTVVRRPMERDEHEPVVCSGSWIQTVDDTQYRVSFSRDNLHVWIDKQGVESTATFSDNDYDITLTFEFPNRVPGMIFSDVDAKRKHIVNQLSLGYYEKRELKWKQVAENYISFETSPEHYTNFQRK